MRVSSIIYRNLWDGVLSLASWFVPKKKGSYVFTAQDGSTYNGNPKYLYHYFKNSKEVAWMTNDLGLKDSLTKQGINVIYTLSSEGFISTLRAEYIFIDNGILGPFAYCWLPPFGRFRIIQTWHGTGVKGHGKITGMDMVIKFLSNLSYNVVLASSEHHRDAFKELFMTDHVTITGSPRNDILFEQDHSLQYDGYDTVFLYAPTFRDDHQFTPFSESFLTEMDNWLCENNSILLVKPHPLCQAFKLTKPYHNIVDVGEVRDTQEILPCVDVLITDYSSIATDYALIDRPIIFYFPDHDRFKEVRSLYFDIEKGLPGPFAYNERDLLDLINDLNWFDTESYRTDYSKFKDFWHTHQDGKSCERVEAMLEEI